MRLLTLAVCLCVVRLSASFLESTGSIRSDHVSVAIDARTTRDADDEYHVTVTGPDGPMKLHYRRDLENERSFPVYLSGETVREVRDTGDENWALYGGVDHDGAAIIRRDTGSPSGIDLEGYIVKRDKLLTIHPVEGADHIIHEEDPSQSLEDDGVVQRDAPLPAEFRDLSPPGEMLARDVDPVIVSRSADPDLERLMEVELKINFDYLIYKRMYDRTYGNFADDAAHKAETILQLKQYYAILIYAMNMRFRPIREAGMNVNIIVGGLLISDTINGSLWTMYDYFDPNATFDGRDTMDKFWYYIDSKPGLDVLEPYDHWQVHSTFGIDHDPGTDECPGYSLMWHTGSSTGHYHVTNCTLRQLRENLNGYMDTWFSCLLKRESDDGAELSAMNAATLGQLRSINDQCARHHGDGNNWIAYSSVDADVCSALYCKPIGEYWGYSMEVLAHTSCGDNKWCELGMCVYDENAPLLEPTCNKAGDYPNCWNRLNATTLGQCYDGGNLAWECCHMCRANKVNDSECHWGQNHHACALTDCYIGNKCCDDFCEKGRLSEVPGCEWGDRITSCDQSDKSQCYTQSYAEECCASCPKWKTPENVGCEWGDQIKNCQPYMCYDATQAALCCDSCPKWKKEGGGDCQYGDKLKETCERKHCYNKDTRAQCCESCPLWKKTNETEEELCYQEGVAGSYLGTLNTTVSGRTCQRWDDTSTHSHSYDLDDFPGDDTLPENYCRLAGSAHPWCYTTDPGKRWDLCDVPMCPVCEYGEWYTSCPSKPAWYCYYDSERIPCCEHCPRILEERNDPGCPYGDRYYPTSYCNLNNSTKKACYGWQIHNICCDTCPKLADGPTDWWTVDSGCTYGDRIEGCTGEMCATDEERKQCCGTCANVEVIPV